MEQRLQQVLPIAVFLAAVCLFDACPRTGERGVIVCPRLDHYAHALTSRTRLAVG
jgi:hypothetical protein